MNLIKVPEYFGGKSINYISEEDTTFQSFTTCQKSFFSSLNKKNYLNFMAELCNRKHVGNS